MINRTQVLLLMLVCAVAAAASPAAFAKPTSGGVDAVYVHSECASPIKCNPSSDHPLPHGSVVTGEIQIAVSAHSGLAGLSRVRLEAKPPESKDYYCVQQWFGDRQIDFSQVFNWNTPNWPTVGPYWGCPEDTDHYHGDPANNGDYLLRIVAWDVSDDENPYQSSGFPIKLANAPQPPAWLDDPKPSGAVVTLRWKPNKERDISEYHFIRVGPDGRASAFAVEAKSPSSQGCSKVSTLYYSCTDTRFAGARSGTYRYTLVALRPSPASAIRCSIGGGKCSQSGFGETRTATVTVPEAIATASPSQSLTASGPAGSGQAVPSQLAAPSTLPSSEPQTPHALAGSHSSGGQGPPRATAAVLAGLVGALLLYVRSQRKGLPQAVAKR